MSEESRLLEQVRHLAIEELGLLAHHRTDSRLDIGWSNGFPDVLIASRAGRGLLAVELKSTGAQLSRDQQRWRWALEASTDRPQHLVWRPRDWDSGEIKARLQFLVRP